MPDRLLDVSRLHIGCRYIYLGHCQMSGTYFRACELEIWRIFSDKFLVWNLLGLTYIMFPINCFTARDVSSSRGFLRLQIDLERIIYCYNLYNCEVFVFFIKCVKSSLKLLNTIGPRIVP